MKSIRLVEVEREKFLTELGQTIQREMVGETPGGNPFNGRWVLRDKDGVYIDHDRFRHDLWERNGIDFNPTTLKKFLQQELA